MIQLLNSLRQKLAFNHPIGSESDIISHSRQIPELAALAMTLPSIPEPLDGKIVRSDPFELIVDMDVLPDCKIGDTWTVRYCDGGSVWEFNSELVRQVRERVHLRHSNAIRLINRRSFPRVPLRRSVKIAPFPFDVHSRVDELPRFRPAQIVELAGIGLKLEADTEFAEGQRALIVLRLRPDKAIQSLAKVRRCTLLGPGQYLLILELVGLSLRVGFGNVAADQRDLD